MFCFVTLGGRVFEDLASCSVTVTGAAEAAAAAAAAAAVAAEEHVRRFYT